MDFREIVLHPSPDLDAIVAAWLLQRFGEDRFPGSSSAKLRFASPDSIDGPRLEMEGVLAVDVGGGRFDHHPGEGDLTEAPARCAAELVAGELGLDSDPRLKKILALTHRRDIEGIGVRSRDVLDQVAHLVALIDGWNGLFPDAPTEVCQRTFECLDAIRQNESHWCEALALVDHGTPIIFPGTRLKVDRFESDNARLMKASRYRRRDACVVRDTNGNTGINVHFGSARVRTENLIETAAHLRLFECEARSIEPDPNQLRSIGLHHGWFLHSSGRLLLSGSRKHPDTDRSVLPLQRVAEVVGVSLHPEHRFPDDLCPGTHCVGERCFLFPHELKACKGPKKRGIRG